MGCDIHFHIELNNGKEWVHYANPSISRNYDFFALLANIRNGCTNITPISEPKGLPKDISLITKIDSDILGNDGHSHSWLSSNEIIKLENWLNDERKKHVDMPFGSYELEYGILHTYLFGNSFTSFLKYDDIEYLPKPFTDVRFVFWFDN